MTLTVDKPVTYATQSQWYAATWPDDLFFGQTIPVGSTVEYRGHTIGGMIYVQFGDQQVVIDPRATKELR